MKEIKTDKGIFTVKDLGMLEGEVLPPLDDEDRYGGTVTLATPQNSLTEWFGKERIWESFIAKRLLRDS